jgi:hypothetical protein
VIELTVSFAVTDGHGLPIAGDALDAQLDAVEAFLRQQDHVDLADIDVDASLGRGEVTFSMLVEATDDDVALIRAISVLVPAIRAVGGVLHLGQVVNGSIETSDVWRPRDLVLA